MTTRPRILFTEDGLTPIYIIYFCKLFSEYQVRSIASHVRPDRQSKCVHVHLLEALDKTSPSYEP